jgi:exodeoxyribonuclease V alpha subunit
MSQYSNIQILNQLGIFPGDLDHYSAALHARLFPELADAVYLTTLVLLLRQQEGAIAIPWPNPRAESGNQHSQPSRLHQTDSNKSAAPIAMVLDLLTENLPSIHAGLQTGNIRQAFAELGEVSLQALLEAGAIYKPVKPLDSCENAVIILDRGRLYMRRFWRYEAEVAAMVTSRSARVPIQPSMPSESIPESGTEAPTDKLQELAVQSGLNYPFTVITGGPGTGKTHSVLMLLIAMLRLNPELRIVLCAPTGKAAARMMESIQGNLTRINPPSELLQKIPDTASTIHRLIRWNPALGKSAYNAKNPLPFDVIILDEASMVDVALMSRLARALRPDTRLVLLGDKDQLSSVEAGSVFADIASQQAPNIVRLTKSWRFSDDSEIGQLARLINSGEAQLSWNLLTEESAVGLLRPMLPDISTQTMRTSEETANTSKEALYRTLNNAAQSMHTALLGEPDHHRAFTLLQGSQILTALRVGHFGSEHINAEVDRRLGKGAVWYEGRPVIATSNNYDLEVYNGDVGLTRYVDNRLMVAFAGSTPGTVRWIAPAQLKSVSSAWALTVHKSQGSEYDQVFFVLPDRPAPVITRELGYTALTRARKNFRVWGGKFMWEIMISNRVERYSGLADRLK